MPDHPDEFEVSSTRSMVLANVAAAMVANNYRDRGQRDAETLVLLTGAVVAMCRASGDPGRAFDATIETLRACATHTARALAEANEIAEAGGR
jgi:hypothetical protein